jgi:hypothetical protein
VDVGTVGFHKQGTQPDLVSMCLKDSAADVMRCECGNISKTGGYCVDRGSGRDPCCVGVCMRLQMATGVAVKNRIVSRTYVPGTRYPDACRPLSLWHRKDSERGTNIEAHFARGIFGYDYYAWLSQGTHCLLILPQQKI